MYLLGEYPKMVIEFSSRAISVVCFWPRDWASQLQPQVLGVEGASDLTHIIPDVIFLFTKSSRAMEKLHERQSD